jgi:hypothetical protein
VGIWRTSRSTSLRGHVAARERRLAPEPGPSPDVERSHADGLGGVPALTPLRRGKGSPDLEAIPALDHATTLPSVSVIVTVVLLKDAWMCASP